MKLLNLIIIYSAELIEAGRFPDAGLELLNSNTEENLRIFPFNYKKTSYPIARRLFAMRRYGGGMLYAALPLHMQRGYFLSIMIKKKKIKDLLPFLFNKTIT